jgi:hypothetical protein
VLPALASLLSPVDDEDDDVEGAEVVEVEGGLKLLLLMEEPLLKPPYVASPWSPMPNRSRPNDCHAQ